MAASKQETSKPANRSRQLLSVITPVFNESPNLNRLYRELTKVLSALDLRYELIFINDGSTDNSLKKLTNLEKKDKRVVVLDLTRNFGKEIAITAGLHHVRGDAAITIDADLQHPVALIPKFIDKWQKGAEVVVGVRSRYHNERWTKKVNSWLFYKLLNSMADIKVTPSATDYRLLDRSVIDEFNRLTEHNRVSRGLIDWLGFNHDFIYFEAAGRYSGKVGYSFFKRIRLAIDSFVSLSLLPLRLAGYLGIMIIILSGALGLFILIEKYILHDPMKLAISGPAMLALIIVFLVGIILICLGLIALYIATIHREVLSRPLYVIRNRKRHR